MLASGKQAELILVSIRLQAKAKTARADSSDELADSEDDGGLSDHADKAGPIIIDDDEDDGGSGATDDQDGASEGKSGILSLKILPCSVTTRRSPQLENTHVCLRWAVYLHLDLSTDP